MDHKIILRLLAIIILCYLPKSGQGQYLTTYLRNKAIIDSLLTIHAEFDSVSYLQMVKYTYPCKKVKKDINMMLLLDDIINTDATTNRFNKYNKKGKIYFQDSAAYCTRYIIYGGYLMSIIYNYQDSISIDIMCYYNCDIDLFWVNDYYNYEYINRYVVPYIRYPIYFGEKGFFSFNMKK